MDWFLYDFAVWLVDKGYVEPLVPYPLEAAREFLGYYD